MSSARRKSPQRNTAATNRKTLKISPAALRRAKELEQVIKPFEPYQPPAGVIPKGKERAAMAMDETPYDYVNQVFVNNFFPGYQYLAGLAQMAEYRKFSEVPAEDMTREWIRLRSTGDDDKTDKINQLNDALERYKIRSLFQQAAEVDGFFGRAQLYIDMKAPNGELAADKPAELSSPLVMSEKKITKGSLRGFVLVEPIWTYPGTYNANNPLAPDFYRPSSWYVMGKTVHHSRMLTFISRPVPDLLKASYNFGGLSMTQMAQAYVNNWLRTRDSVSDLVHSFSVSGIKTDMSEVLMGTDDAQFFSRAELFNKLRDNRGLMLLDKDMEEFFQFNTPLSGLGELQSQSQEHQSMVASIPLVKLFGVTPSGLNASSEGEIQVYYDGIAGRQVKMFKDPLETVLKVIQLSEFGEIDPDITFEFEPLYGVDQVEAANIRKTNAETDVTLVQGGIIEPAEARKRVASDPESGYDSLEGDLDDEVDETGTELETDENVE